jgi:hypothetical protein
MAATLTVGRTFSIVESVPTTVLSVTGSTSIPVEIFLHKVDDRGEVHDSYLGISTLDQLNTYGTIRTGGATIYRKSSATVTYKNLVAAVADKDVQVTTLDNLLDEYALYSASFIGTDTLELSSDD